MSAAPPGRLDPFALFTFTPGVNPLKASAKLETGKSLMSSGFSGQSFTFHGYLPIDKVERAKRIKANAKKELEKMGLSNVASAKLNNLKAPMPGLIYEMKVKVGDEVKKGDTLLILVAMKMENAIKAVGDGIVKSIKTNTGDSVEKGQLIMEFE